MCPATDNRQFSCHVIARRPAGPTWARHQPSGLPNARSLCVRLQSVSPRLGSPPLGELSPKVIERACRGGRPCPPKPAGLTRPAEGSGPYEMSADRTLVGRGPCLPTVVPAESRPLPRPTAGALPRNRLASSATGGASAISPKFPLPAQKGRADRWPVRPQVRRKMVRKKRYYSSMASSHTAPMAAPPNRAASHGDIRSRRRGGAPWVRA